MSRDAIRTILCAKVMANHATAEVQKVLRNMLYILCNVLRDCCQRGIGKGSCNGSAHGWRIFFKFRRSVHTCAVCSNAASPLVGQGRLPSGPAIVAMWGDSKPAVRLVSDWAHLAGLVPCSNVSCLVNGSEAEEVGASILKQARALQVQRDARGSQRRP